MSTNPVVLSRQKFVQIKVSHADLLPLFVNKASQLQTTALSSYGFWPDDIKPILADLNALLAQIEEIAACQD